MYTHTYIHTHTQRTCTILILSAYFSLALSISDACFHVNLFNSSVKALAECATQNTDTKWQADLSQAWWRRNSQEDSKVKKEEEKKPFLVFRYMDTALPNLRCVSVHEHKEWDEFLPCQPQDHQRFPTQMQDCEHNWGVTTLYPVHPAAPA